MQGVFLIDGEVMHNSNAEEFIQYSFCSAHFTLFESVSDTKAQL